MAAAMQQCNCEGGQCTQEQCNCCPWCCKTCQTECKHGKKKCNKKNFKCGLNQKHKECTDKTNCCCSCCIELRNPQGVAIFWCIIAFIIFAIFLAFAFILYKTKSKAYMIPKVVYEWTGYTSTYSGLGSKNLS